MGLTPGDEYWAYINRDTHLMDRWAYRPPGPARSRGTEPTVWRWQGWQRYGKIMLAPNRAQVGGDRKLELGDIAVARHPAGYGLHLAGARCRAP